ncbi:MAG: TIGR01777 family oxidoreductase [Gemmatimonadetes bacterium]|nr:TIGR01777 family oxidoreductase [Gemmatimonadota bacterium]
MSLAERAIPQRPWRVAITGASGLVGSALATSLESQGHAVLRLVRGRAGPGEAHWDPARGELDAAALEGVSVVVNLAGESIAQRWTPAVKERIRRSRVDGTRLLATALAGLRERPAVLVNGSASGYYGDRGGEWLTESSGPGSDFLAGVAQEWEAATAPAADAGIRVALPRLGLVLSRQGGILERMLPAFRLGVGGRLGSGKQWMSWITDQDLLDAIQFVITTPELSGPINAASPHPVINDEFTHTLGRVLSRPTLFPVPRVALELAFGEMAGAALFAGQRVAPERLQRAGFTFRHPTLEEALRAVLETRG